MPRRIDGGRGMTRRRKAAEEATKRGIEGEGCRLARGIAGETRGIAGERQERGGRGERGG